jgi:dipeptidyl aminopeptidase/acylaminoacyl peptidase
VIAAAVAAAALSCHPQPGLGSLTYTRSGRQYVVDLSNCRDRVVRPGAVKPQSLISPDGRFAATVVATRKGDRGMNAIVVRNRSSGAKRTIYRLPQSYVRVPAGAPGPILLFRWSGDGSWLFFAIDPMGSQSIAADGLLLQVISADGGRPHRIGMTLAYTDYLAWCNRRLIFTGGGDRLATTNKRLLVVSPTNWRPHPLVNAPGRAWGSLTCARDGRSVVVQSQQKSKDYDFAHTHWALWQVGLDGSTRQLTSPPKGSADESPRFSRDGRSIFFVRSHGGRGTLYALKAGNLTGPLLPLGYNLGYYGHRCWWLGC